MTLIATPDESSLHAAPRAVQSQPANTRAAPDNGARTLSQAIQAVNDHRREVEMRRMALAAQYSASPSDWSVPVPHSQLHMLEQQAREAARLRGLLDSGPLIAVPFGAHPPYALREMPASLSRTIDAAHDAGAHEHPLTRLFVASDVPRLQQALDDGDAVTLIAHLRRSDGRALRCSVHLSALDSADPDCRWACIVRLPQPSSTAQPAHERHLPPKPNQRSRVDAWPASSA